ncbi:nuclear factor NF-kappa-B p110 subunit-like [Trichogramma pretiosum]|uniref:nuclear factor NF-kappa-B p110 subunit-like n=1 Tax=Trichogramma pretiosum TaxID=7493 RepID=UPI0006C96718|nr:nuclear factor NF-kappa-B p110 subunit-like [Trichogramma pretiosum]XP_014230862.1 nuclear factor NF-kappa-B p110 subunit-like [Trichogramma pretiosum]
MELPAMLLPAFEELINLDASERPLGSKCHIHILVQPIDKYGFRYKSEPTIYRRLLGEGKSIGQLKKAPTVQMINCPFEKAIIRCSLVTADSNRFLHPYCLVRRNDTSDLDNHYDEEVSDKNNFTATFDDIRIIITIKKKIREVMITKKINKLLEEKMQNSQMHLSKLDLTEDEILQIRLTTENEMKCINVNSACLSFQGFYYGPNNILYPLTDRIYSQSVNNSRNASTGKLKIYRSSKSTGSTLGDEEVWLLVQKVEKTNIKIKFLEVDYDGEPTWQADGKFSESDVHHQVLIIFRTPAYKNKNIIEPKKVSIRLYRPSDDDVSNEIHFTYIPMCVSQNEN